jgi:uncharacterized membrane protein YukC
MNIKTGVGPITDKFINDILNKCVTKETKQQLYSNVIEPYIIEVNTKMKKYMYIGLGMYGAIILLLIYIIYILWKGKRR